MTSLESCRSEAGFFIRELRTRRINLGDAQANVDKIVNLRANYSVALNGQGDAPTSTIDNLYMASLNTFIRITS